MILADKIINERKKNGWSQEELAEKLSVSRQSVSKWEGAQAVPDLQKIIKLAEIFHVSTDYLLKDEMEPETQINNLATFEEATSEPPRRKVSMEEAVEFLKTEKKYSGWIANAVSLCILSPIALLLLAAFSESGRIAMTEDMAGGLGVVILLIIVAVAVSIFIISGGKTERFEYLEKEAIETEYGVIGMVNEKKKAYEGKYNLLLVTGVVLCILSAVPLMGAAMLDAADELVICTVGILLAIISIATNLFVRSGMIMGSYQKLLQEKEYTVEQKKAGKVIDKIAAIYWMLVVAGYLGWSFATMRWDFTWIVWPVAGVLFAVVVTIIKVVMKVEE